jgi:hypothetical protein
VTNIGVEVLGGSAVVAAYQDLWRVEESFRMSKSDLQARPVFHRKKDSIDAHLTIVFAALAVARYLQDRTGVSIKRLVQVLRPLGPSPSPSPGSPSPPNPASDPTPSRSSTRFLISRGTKTGPGCGTQVRSDPWNGLHVPAAVEAVYDTRRYGQTGLRPRS